MLSTLSAESFDLMDSTWGPQNPERSPRRSVIVRSSLWFGYLGANF